ALFGGLKIHLKFKNEQTGHLQLLKGGTIYLILWILRKIHQNHIKRFYNFIKNIFLQKKYKLILDTTNI
ncbi:MAG: hypothetical protein P1P88_09125, partial [Bacteroidales bacterium]|nr:hypothetical protein [Bacteroidales bacterium]